MTALLSAAGLQIRPGVVHAIIELALCSKRPLSEADFVAHLQPDSLRKLAKDGDLPNVVPLGIELCLGLGLLGRSNEVFTPSDLVRDIEPRDLNLTLRKLVGKVFGATKNLDVAPGSDLLQSLAWLLAQDVWTTPAGLQEFEQLQSHQRRTTENLQFINDTKDPVLRDWGVYLGMVALDPLTRAASRQLLIDPTVAVRSAVTDFLDAEMTASGFLERLAERLCVVDGGTARRRVVGEIDASALPWETDESAVSPTLSLALYRLERSGYLIMTSKADAPASERRQLMLGVGKPNRVIDRVAPGTQRESEVR